MKKVDRTFLFIIILLTVGGFFIFTSASLGLVAKDENRFGMIALKQLIIGIVCGSIICIAAANLHYKLLKKYSFFIFVGSIIVTLLLFIPHIGIQLKGATRWISIGGFTFQPSELFKLGFVIYFAALLSSLKQKIENPKFGLGAFVITLAIAASLILTQPDTDTYFIIFFAGLAMYLAAGCKWRDIFLICAGAVVAFAIILAFRPYVRDRVMTFIHPSANARTTGYQIQQSLIAVGSGGLTGRGFGQSIQKFNFLPEPIGDSIFAVASEEFGFIGSTLIILCFVFFGIRGMKIAAQSNDMFGRLMVVGIVILITSESFINIGAMLGVMPLSGTPLLFVSQGGSALLLALAEVGIILNISKYQQKS